MRETEPSLFSDKPAERQLGAKGSFNRMTIEDVEAQAQSGTPAAIDPMAAALTGAADPTFGQIGFAIGDKIYHKTLKEEGKVKDLLASGKVIIELDSGKKGTVSPDKIVKL